MTDKEYQELHREICKEGECPDCGMPILCAIDNCPHCGVGFTWQSFDTPITDTDLAFVEIREELIERREWGLFRFYAVRILNSIGRRVNKLSGKLESNAPPIYEHIYKDDIVTRYEGIKATPEIDRKAWDKAWRYARE